MEMYMELRLQLMYKEGHGISLFNSLWIHSEHLNLSFASS